MKLDMRKQLLKYEHFCERIKSRWLKKWKILIAICLLGMLGTHANADVWGYVDRKSTV